MEKDATDLLVLAEAEKRNLPVFAICFGMQSLNVSRGGTLIQDIGSHVDGCLKHEQGIPRDRVSHTITIEKGTRLSKLSSKASQVRVNSHHHQAVATVGNNLKASAYAADGVVECIEDTRKERYVVGVQWHPELCWKTDALSRSLFQDFVKSYIKVKH
jgi:putative glutamine amidotransferase